MCNGYHRLPRAMKAGQGRQGQVDVSNVPGKVDGCNVPGKDDVSQYARKG